MSFPTSSGATSASGVGAGNPSTPEVTLNNTLGAVFIGYSFACMIFGIVTTQVINYYHRFPADSPIMKTLVGMIWSLEFLHVALISHAVYHYTISLFGELSVIVTAPPVWSLVLQILVAAISEIIVQVFLFCVASVESHHNMLVTGVIALVIVVHVVYILDFTIKSYQLSSILDLSVSIKAIGSIAFATSALADVLVATSLTFYLRKLRTGFTEPDSLVNSLTAYAVNTGALTSTMSLLALILFDAKSHTFQFIGVYFVLSKTFAVSFMCTLNTRKIMSNSESEGEVTGINHATNTFIMDGMLPSASLVQPYLLKEARDVIPTTRRSKFADLT